MSDVASASEAAYLQLVEMRIRSGNLSERIRTAVEARASTDAARADVVRGVYLELAGCLDTNTPWH